MFIKNFESPKTNLPIKMYTNCKLHTFQTLNLEYVCMDEIFPDVSMDLEPFFV
jgi:hypothetical protein